MVMTPNCCGSADRRPGTYYLNPAVFLIILLAWAVIPLLAGHLRFHRADLS